MFNPRQYILNQAKLLIKISTLKAIQHLINKQKNQIRQKPLQNLS